MYLKICSLKMLHYLLRQGKLDGACAIILATETPLKTDLLDSRLISYIHVPFPDTASGMTAQMARKIAVFYDELPDCEVLCICCDAAESRSPGAAAALLRYEGQDDVKLIWRNARYHPNAHVFSMVSQALGLCISNRELRHLVRISEKAYRDAINKQKR